MLNSFENQVEASPTRPGHRVPGLIPVLGPLPQQGPLARLIVRRWLLLLFLLIMFALMAASSLHWPAAVAAFIVFAGAAAVIPRSGIPVFPRHENGAERPRPLQVASALIGALPEPAILLSSDGTIQSFNGEALSLLRGLKEGAHLSSAIRSPSVLEALANCSPEQPLHTADICDRVPIERHLAVTLCWFDPGYGTSLILVFLRDLTEQRRLDQLRADFIANASHEIKTPLASLLGFIETLQGAARNDEAARDRFLAIMVKQGQRMARLIDNLMSLSRIEMRAHLQPQGIVAIGELVLQACDTLEPMASGGSISVAVRIEADRVVVQGDRDELTQVVINLLHNAIKYGHPGGHVEVKVRRVEHGRVQAIEIVIEDDGLGISPRHLPRVTERFYRVPEPAAQEKGGTGLGLAIVKHVLNRHRGELRIHSKEGLGSQFVVRLPEYVVNPENGGNGNASHGESGA
jgi:two-component system, OmpR family, phosphate regulon sensor histidine kinase PhoR